MTPIAIVAHTKREKMVGELTEKVRPRYVVWDNGLAGCAKNHYRAWAELMDDGTGPYSLVLEDDAVPIQGLSDMLPNILENAPTPVVSLYLGRCRPPHWQPSVAQTFASLDRRVFPDAPNPSWFLADELLHGVAVAIRTDLIESMLLYAKIRMRHYPMDEIIGQWSREVLQVPIGYTHPSVCDHADAPTVIREHISAHPGETGERVPGRRAWKFGTRVWDSTTMSIPNPAL